MSSNQCQPARNIDDRGMIAVLIPCHNEEASIGTVVNEIRSVLPSAEIHVYDNNSTDSTVLEAKKAGAQVSIEKRQGKGFVVRRFFADVDADIYVMIDGDDTYDALSAGKLVSHLHNQRLDMVIGSRAERESHATVYRPGHKFGNRLLSATVALLFGQGVRDMLSGYRVFSRRFVKTFPAASRGFEIETELTVHALALEVPVDELETPFGERAAGSESKLRTFKDGFVILLTIFRLLSRERPTFVFGWLAVFFLAFSIYLAVPVARTYIETGLVPRFPTLIASVGLAIISLLSMTCGLVLDAVTASRRETKRLAYLSYSAGHAGGRVGGY